MRVQNARQVGEATLVGFRVRLPFSCLFFFLTAISRLFCLVARFLNSSNQGDHSRNLKLHFMARITDIVQMTSLGIRTIPPPITILISVCAESSVPKPWSTLILPPALGGKKAPSGSHDKVSLYEKLQRDKICLENIRKLADSLYVNHGVRENGRALLTLVSERIIRFRSELSMLLVTFLIRFCKESGIVVEESRGGSGSAGGSAERK